MYAHITTARLLRLGFSREEVRRALRCCLQRVARGRYVTEFVCADPTHRDLWESIKDGPSKDFVQVGDIRDKVERLKVLIRARGEYLQERLLSQRTPRGGEVFSHLSAALIHELPVSSLSEHRVEVVRPKVSRTYANLRVRRRLVPHSQRVKIGIYTVTSLERSLIDVARDYPLRVSVPMLDHALRGGSTGLAELRLVTCACDEIVGTRNVEKAIELADGRRESVAESICAVRFHEFGIVGFAPQVNIFDAAQNWMGRVDFCHERAKVIVEVDGIGKYSLGSGDPKKEIEKERLRESALSAAGYQVIRLTWRQLFRSELFNHILHSTASRLSAD
ncbi:MAG: DUF559 domain-containing protein [Brevibacterium sp.]|nr:DUF559 domain-containing protein [Brevibacterium sp.]